jgi:hypothetical protein
LDHGGWLWSMDLCTSPVASSIRCSPSSAAKKISWSGPWWAQRLSRRISSSSAMSEASAFSSDPAPNLRYPLPCLGWRRILRRLTRWFLRLQYYLRGLKMPPICYRNALVWCRRRARLRWFKICSFWFYYQTLTQVVK